MMKILVLLFLMMIVPGLVLFSQNKTKIQVIDDKASRLPNTNLPKPIPEKKSEPINVETDHHREQVRYPDVMTPKDNNSRIPDYENPPLPEKDENHNPLLHGYVPALKVNYPHIETKVIYTSEKERGLELLDRMDYNGAMKLFLASLDKNTKDLELYYLIGITEIFLQYYDDAIKDLDYYLSFFGDDGEAFYNRGLAKFHLGLKSEAYTDFTTSINLGCDKANPLLKRYY